jgi:general secretion pathway protein G
MRMLRSGKRLSSGLTFIELLFVLALMSILALGALPYVHYKQRRIKELELKRTLTMMRNAIDLYHEYAALGQIEAWDVAWNMYPKDFDMLVDGVDVVQSPEVPPKKVHFLRKVPVDPMTGETDWDCRGYKDDADARKSSCDDVYDVFSHSQEQALDGTYYKDW